MEAQLYEAALVAVRDCMGITGGETFLVVTDKAKRGIAEALWKAGCDLEAEAMIIEMIARKNHGEEPPTAVTEMMCKVDAVLCPTSTSLTHTEARRVACAAGARVGTLPDISEDCMIRCMRADYEMISKRTLRLSEILTAGSTARVTTAAGTDLTLPIAGIKAISSTGIIRDPGSFGNLPSGESYLMPEEGLASGRLVVDGAMAGVGMIGDEPLTIDVEGGFAREIRGGPEADRLVEMLDRHGPAARNIAELGVGTNDQAVITGQVLEDEKVMGTIHVALGNNITMGGTCDVSLHLDGVVCSPTMTVDGRVILDEGRFVEELL